MMKKSKTLEFYEPTSPLKPLSNAQSLLTYHIRKLKSNVNYSLLDIFLLLEFTVPWRFWQVCQEFKVWSPCIHLQDLNQVNVTMDVGHDILQKLHISWR